MIGGKLRHRIDIEAATRTPDPATGEPVPTWNTIATIHASIEPLSGKYLEQARALVPTVTHRVMMRYTPAAVMTNRIRYQCRTFTINSVLNRDERNIELTLLCTELAGGEA